MFHALIKKRRKITLLRTVSGNTLDFSLYRAISNRHGISNLTPHAHQILNELYNCYTYKEHTVLVYNIQKTGPIKPRELSRLIYGNTECLYKIIPEDNISTKMQLHSSGDVVYLLRDIYAFAASNWKYIFGLLIVLGGGSAISFKVPGIIDIIKNALSAKEEIREKKLNNDSKEVDIQLKRVELYEKIKASGINPETLISPLEALCESAASLQAEPIVLGDEQTTIGSINLENEDLEDEESNDTEDE